MLFNHSNTSVFAYGRSFFSKNTELRTCRYSVGSTFTDATDQGKEHAHSSAIARRAIDGLVSGSMPLYYLDSCGSIINLNLAVLPYGTISGAVLSKAKTKYLCRLIRFSCCRQGHFSRLFVPTAMVMITHHLRKNNLLFMFFSIHVWPH